MPGTGAKQEIARRAAGSFREVNLEFGDPSRAEHCIAVLVPGKYVIIGAIGKFGSEGEYSIGRHIQKGKFEIHEILSGGYFIAVGCSNLRRFQRIE